jgi:hypothetical protein
MAREDLTDAEKWLYDHPDISSTPTVYSEDCYICRDPDFSRMGMPLCYECMFCEGHVAADDAKCDDCGREQERY